MPWVFSSTSEWVWLHLVARGATPTIEGITDGSRLGRTGACRSPVQSAALERMAVSLRR